MKPTKQQESQGKPAELSEPANKPSLAEQVAQDKREREQAFSAALDRLCQQYRVGLRPVVVIVGNAIESRIEVLATE